MEAGVRRQVPHQDLNQTKVICCDTLQKRQQGRSSLFAINHLSANIGIDIGFRDGNISYLSSVFPAECRDIS
jgi:hypothetical protein